MYLYKYYFIRCVCTLELLKCGAGFYKINIYAFKFW